MDHSTTILRRSDFIWNVEQCAPAQSIFARSQPMTQIRSPYDRNEEWQMAQPVTLPKLLMVALVIGLGAVAASLVSESNFLLRQSSISYVMSGDATRLEAPPRTATTTTHHQFVERTPIPYIGAGGNLISNRDPEYEY